MALSIWLPDEQPVSWNTLMRMHWAKQQEENRRVQWTVFEALAAKLGPNRGDWPVFDRPVCITMTAYFEGRPLDASNLTLKLFEDGLVGTVLSDDNPRFVAEVRLQSRKAGNGHKPGVMIQIEEA